jgi:uncharacterized protein (DUF362 family)
MKSKVALVKGNDRAQNIDTALRLIGDEIDLKHKKSILIKVNFVSTRNQLAATHIDAVRALLEFIRDRYDGKITIGESTLGAANVGYERFGYLDLVKEYGVELVDLNNGEWELVDLYDSSLSPMKLHFSRRVIDSDYLIAVGPAKTHDTVGVTLSLKNVSMGGLSYTHGDKRKMHQGYPVNNLNLYLLAKLYPPNLSIVDGFVGMEGDGPLFGSSVKWGTVIVSCDPVAADCLAAELMGFAVSDIGYLWYCHNKELGIGDIRNMNILGTNLDDCYHKFKPHFTFEEQKQWHDDRIQRIVFK